MDGARLWKNCRIIIKDKDNDKVIADTRILSVAPGKHAVKVSASSVNGRLGERIFALIFARNGMLQYRGVIKGPVIANEVEIVLHAGGKKEDRECERYNIQTEGFIEAVILGNDRIVLQKPIEVVTVNMGANGILIRTFPGSFEVGDKIELVIDLQQKQYRSIYEIVRAQNRCAWNEEYGCRDITQGREWQG
jgi:hypothetical protein